LSYLGYNHPMTEVENPGAEFLMEKYKNTSNTPPTPQVDHEGGKMKTTHATALPPGLHHAPEVHAAMRRDMARSIEQGVENPKMKGGSIQQYLDRLTDLVLDPENKQRKTDMGDIAHTMRPRALHLLRNMATKRYFIQDGDVQIKEKIADAAIDVEKRAARALGHGDVEYTAEQRAERAEIAVTDLTSSLDGWITYLSDPGEPYPDWFRYYVFRNVLQLSQYDKTKGVFPQRTVHTVKLFPDLDRAALGYVQDRISAAHDPTILANIRGEQTRAQAPESELLTKEKAKEFANRSFAKQYAEAISVSGEITPELRKETRGEWKKYPQGKDARPLWSSLQSKGTAWCIAGYSTAEKYQGQGDFHVYYTHDSQGQPTIPRIAIRMEGNYTIGEIRGVQDTAQNLEGNMLPILDTKLLEFGIEGQKYVKKSADMKRLTNIEMRVKTEPLTTDDLRFLYEVDGKIDGFGYQTDPRIKQILTGRDTRGDLAQAAGCLPTEVSLNQKEALSGQIKIHYGDLDLSKMTSGVGLKLPERITGSLNLSGLTSAKNTNFPSYIGGGVDLRGLTSTEGLNLPHAINGSLDLDSLISPDRLILPHTINGGLNLHSLTSATGLQFPDRIKGGLDLHSLPSAEGLRLPDTINGYLDLHSIASAVGVTLPHTIGGYLDLGSLISAVGLKFPDTINGSLYLGGLTSSHGLNLPDAINGSLDLDSLISPDRLILPHTINGGLNLHSLTSATGLQFPDRIKGGLDLHSLPSAEGLRLPDTINGYLDLHSLTSAVGLILPNTMYGFLDLSRLPSADGLKFPHTIDGSLDLRSLTSGIGVTLPHTINGNLDLRSLPSAVGVTLPDTVDGDLNLSGLTFAEGLILPHTITGGLDLNSLISAVGLNLPDRINGNLNLGNLSSGDGLRLPNVITGFLDLPTFTSAAKLTLPHTIKGFLDLGSNASAAVRKLLGWIKKRLPKKI